MTFLMRKSVHGRQMGISTTGGFISDTKSTGGGSTAFDMAAQMWGKAMFQTVSSAGTVITNNGVSVISGSTNGAAMTMAAPVQGVYKEIHFQTTSTAHSINTTAVTIFFNTTLAEGSTFGSTILNFAQAAVGLGGSLILRGLSATQWGIVGNSAGAST